MTRCSAILLIVALAGCREHRERSAQPAKQPPKCSDRPNILLVTIDTLRFDSAQRNAPFLASLARRGINFTSAYSTFASTPESHFSLLTGFLSGYTTVLVRPEVSLAFQLRQRG